MNSEDKKFNIISKKLSTTSEIYKSINKYFCDDISFIIYSFAKNEMQLGFEKFLLVVVNDNEEEVGFNNALNFFCPGKYTHGYC